MVSGGFAYGYLFMSQHPDTPKVFKKFLDAVRPSRILEIGSFHGGLTLLLRDVMDELGLQDNPIRTYDIHEQEFLKPLVIDRNVDVLTKNLFNSDYSDWKDNECKKEVEDYLQKEGISLILCDGGCKKCEFNLIAPLLKKEDIIMAHDYAPDAQYFQEHMLDKIWDWHEIRDNDIIETITKLNLKPFNKDLMLNIAWLSLSK